MIRVFFDHQYKFLGNNIRTFYEIIISELKKEIPQIKDKHTIYDPIGINRTGKDLTIVISDL